MPRAKTTISNLARSLDGKLSNPDILERIDFFDDQSPNYADYQNEQQVIEKCILHLKKTSKKQFKKKNRNQGYGSVGRYNENGEPLLEYTQTLFEDPIEIDPTQNMTPKMIEKMQKDLKIAKR